MINVLLISLLLPFALRRCFYSQSLVYFLVHFILKFNRVRVSALLFSSLVLSCFLLNFDSRLLILFGNILMKYSHEFQTILLIEP